MLEKEIMKLGLSDKEVKVYLASMELGPSPVQIISQKAKVNRATTYVIIDSLMEMGLMSTYDVGKKTYFAAEQPGRLLELLKNQEDDVKHKIEILKERMPELRVLFNYKEDRPVVKYFEGLEGLKSVQKDFTDSLKKGDVIYAFVPYDDFRGSGLRAKMNVTAQARIDKNIKMNVIYTSKEGRQIEYEKRERNNLKEFLYLDYKEYPFSGGMNVYGQKIFMIDYKGKTGGIVIENKTLADMLGTFFKLIWTCHRHKEQEKQA